MGLDKSYLGHELKVVVFVAELAPQAAPSSMAPNAFDSLKLFTYTYHAFCYNECILFHVNLAIFIISPMRLLNSIVLEDLYQNHKFMGNMFRPIPYMQMIEWINLNALFIIHTYKCIIIYVGYIL